MSMTKEQKAIEILTKKVDSWKCKRPRNPIKLKRLVDEIDTENNAIETVLNMLKEKDRQINSKSGTINALQYALKERDRKDNIVTKQNKIIDLTINFIYEIWCKYPGSISYELRLNGFNDDECGTCENTNRNCIECLKQYFEKLAKEKGE